MRQLCRTDTFYLGKSVLKFKDLDLDVHLPMTKFIEGPGKRKLGQVPRGHLKTHLWTIADSIRLICNDPNTRILIVCDTAQNAAKMLGLIKRIFQRNRLFQTLFPELIWPCFLQGEGERPERWSAEELEVPRTEDHTEATIEAMGVKGAVVSRHYRHIKLDDLATKEASEAPAVMRRCIDWYQLGESLLVEPEKDHIDVYGTPWTYHDLYRWVEENEPGVRKFFRSCYADEAQTRPLWPARFSMKGLERIRRKQGTFKFSCNPAEAPVLMSDFSEKPIAQIEAGDEVVGYSTGGSERQRRLVKATVLETGSRKAWVYKLVFASGRTIRCTIDHQWFRRKPDKWSRRRPYKPARIGSELHVVDWGTKQQHLPEWGYLAGIIDGEGSCKYHAIQVSQSEVKNPEVCRKLEQTLGTLGLSWKIWRGKIKGKKSALYTLHGGRQTRFDLLRCGRPAKAPQIIESMWSQPCKPFLGQERVVSIKPDREEEVFSFETTSGNYVVWGLASKNCNYMCRPYDPEGKNFLDEWLRYFTIEEGQCVFPGGKRVPIDSLRRFLRIDPAMGESDDAAHNAICVDGMTSEGDIVLLDTWSKRCHPFEMVEQAFSMNSRWQCDQIGIEAVQFQKFLKPYMEQEAERRGIWLDVLPLKTTTRVSKPTRIRAVQPYFERGQVYVQRHQTEFLQQYRDFPIGKLVDLLDVFAYGPQMWERPEDEAERFASEAEYWHWQEGRSELTGY